jgi:hypothetical protein
MKYKLPFMALTAFTATATWAIPIDIQTSNAGGNDGTENILFNEPGLTGSGTTVQGISNQSDALVNFTSTTSLTTPSGGQARIEEDFTELAIALATGTFTKAIFNLDANADGNVTFTVNYLGATGSPFTETFSVGQNGNNFFQVLAGDGAAISSISLVGTTSFEDIAQIRLGGFSSVPDGGATAAMLGLGILALSAFRSKQS